MPSRNVQKKQELFNELKKLSKRANQRLVRLEREFGKDTWASKNLRNRLDTTPLNAWTAKGRVRVAKSMSITQLRATIKATNQFLNSATSTKRGINRVRKTTIKSIAQSLSIDREVTVQEAETLYDMFVDNEFTDLLQYMRASELWAIIEEASSNMYSENDFIDLMKDYIDFGNDLDMKERLKNIYEKYVI